MGSTALLLDGVFGASASGVVAAAVAVAVVTFSAVAGNSVRATEGVARPLAASMVWLFFGVCASGERASCLRVACETLRSVMAASCCSSSDPRSLKSSWSGESSMRRRFDGVDGSSVCVDVAVAVTVEERAGCECCCCWGEYEVVVPGSFGGCVWLLLLLFCRCTAGVPDPGWRILARSCQRKKSHCLVEAHVKKKRPLFLDSFFTCRKAALRRGSQLPGRGGCVRLA